MLKFVLCSSLFITFSLAAPATDWLDDEVVLYEKPNGELSKKHEKVNFLDKTRRKPVFEPQMFDFELSSEKDTVICDKCAPGYGFVAMCNATQKTVCEPCSFGETYSDSEPHFKPCTECSKCGQNMYEEMLCTVTSDTFCDSCMSVRAWRINDLYRNADYVSKCRQTLPASKEEFMKLDDEYSSENEQSSDNSDSIHIEPSDEPADQEYAREFTDDFLKRVFDEISKANLQTEPENQEKSPKIAVDVIDTDEILIVNDSTEQLDDRKISTVRPDEEELQYAAVKNNVLGVHIFENPDGVNTEEEEENLNTKNTEMSLNSTTVLPQLVLRTLKRGGENLKKKQKTGMDIIDMADLLQKSTTQQTTTDEKSSETGFDEELQKEQLMKGIIYKPSAHGYPYEELMHPDQFNFKQLKKAVWLYSITAAILIVVIVFMACYAGAYLRQRKRYRMMGFHLSDHDDRLIRECAKHMENQEKIDSAKKSSRVIKQYPDDTFNVFENPLLNYLEESRDQINTSTERLINDDYEKKIANV